MEEGSRWSDLQVERSIANLLRAGLVFATVLVGIGAAVYLARHGGEPADYHVFRGEPADLRSVGGVLGVAAELAAGVSSSSGCWRCSPPRLPGSRSRPLRSPFSATASTSASRSQCWASCSGASPACSSEGATWRAPGAEATMRGTPSVDAKNVERG